MKVLTSKVARGQDIGASEIRYGEIRYLPQKWQQAMKYSDDI